MTNRRQLPESPYLAAATGRKPSRVPVWFMRQAGRSLPEYRELRAKNTMMQACFDTELITEITLQPIRRHGCLLYTSPSPRDRTRSRMPSSA